MQAPVAVRVLLAQTAVPGTALSLPIPLTTIQLQYFLALLARIASTPISARCGLLVQLSHVAWSTCVSVCACVCKPGKIVEPIEMQFGGRLT